MNHCAVLHYCLPREVKMIMNKYISNKKQWLISSNIEQLVVLSGSVTRRSQQAERSGMAWPPVCIEAEAGWGELTEREKGRKDRHKRTRANNIPDAHTTKRTLNALTSHSRNMLWPSVFFLHKSTTKPCIAWELRVYTKLYHPKEINY